MRHALVVILRVDDSVSFVIYMYFSREIDDVCKPLLTIPNNIRVTESDSQLKPRKACGPDGVGDKVLRECSSSLSSVFCNLFQILLNLHYVPRVWRTSSIILAPKSSHARDLNDFRPIALTSLICKSFLRKLYVITLLHLWPIAWIPCNSLIKLKEG